MSPASTLILECRRTIKANPERLFAAWTTPDQLVSWWGPRGVQCTQAEVDLRVGGRYRLGNQFPNGKLVFIVGEFLVVNRPSEISYTWSIEPSEGHATERVTVRFEPKGQSTEVIVVHERIASESLRQRHSEGWDGCLSGLGAYLETT